MTTTHRKAVFAFCIFSVVSTIDGYSFGAGGCSEGIPAVGAPHLAGGISSAVINGTLSQGIVTVLLDGLPLTSSTTTGPDITVHQNHTLTLQRSSGYKGVLFRLGGVGLDAMSTIDPLLQIANFACTPLGVSGITHTTRDIKSSSVVTLNVGTAAANLPLDITVVIRNNGVSEFYYSPFRLNAVALATTAPTLPPSTTPPTNPPSSAPTSAPTALATKAPTSAPSTHAPSTAQPIATSAPKSASSPVTIAPTSTPVVIPSPPTFSPVVPSAASVAPTPAPVTPTFVPSTSTPRLTRKPSLPTRRPTAPTKRPHMLTRKPVAPSTTHKSTRRPSTRRPSTRRPSTRMPVKRTKRAKRTKRTKTRKPIDPPRRPPSRRPRRVAKPKMGKGRGPKEAKQGPKGK